MQNFLSIAPEVAEALQAGQAVVALESTIISHGMPYPQNVATARRVEQTVRDNGAIPASIALLEGRLQVGLNDAQLEYLGQAGPRAVKASRRDLPLLLAQGRDGATTVAATMIVAQLAGIEIFATGGIGGVHRGAQQSMDISADLPELGHTPVMVVCAGAKAILDIGLTREYLETQGVAVVGYQTDELPAFYTRGSGFPVDYRLDTPQQLARAWACQRGLGYRGGMLVVDPIPAAYAMPQQSIDAAIEQALHEAEQQGVGGKQVTPYLLARVAQLTGGDSLASNIELVCNNAALAAQIAVAYAAQK